MNTLTKSKSGAQEAVEQFNNLLAELERQRVQAIFAAARPRRKFKKPNYKGVTDNDQRTREIKPTR